MGKSRNEVTRPVGDPGEPVEVEQPATEAEKPRGTQQQAQAPACPNCKILCKANNSTPFFTRYYCPNGCGFSLKVPRPDIRRRIQASEQDDFSAR